MPYLVMAVLMIVVGTTVGYGAGKMKGLEEGQKTALKTNPVSEELEMTCLGLWLGEQNKKHYERNK